MVSDGEELFLDGRERWCERGRRRQRRQSRTLHYYGCGGSDCASTAACGDQRACSNAGPRADDTTAETAGTEAAVAAIATVALYDDHMFTSLSSYPCASSLCISAIF